MKTIVAINVSFIDDEGDFRTYNFSTKEDINLFLREGLVGLKCDSLNVCHTSVVIAEENGLEVVYF